MCNAGDAVDQMKELGEVSKRCSKLERSTKKMVAAERRREISQ